MGKKRHERRVMVLLRVHTNLDNADLERRIVEFISPAALQDSLEGLGERIDLMETDVDVRDEDEEPPPKAPRVETVRDVALRKGVKVHEWAERQESKRTVCGLHKPEALLRAVVTLNLGGFPLANRCANCERMRSAIGASRSEAEV